MVSFPPKTRRALKRWLTLADRAGVLDNATVPELASWLEEQGERPPELGAEEFRVLLAMAVIAGRDAAPEFGLGAN